MNRVITIAAALLVLSLAACKPKPKPIEYGHQACDFCRMSIVDERYAAQLVTETGKTYSFDALECMLHYKKEHTDEHWHMELLTDYNHPKKLIPAHEALIVRSKQLPSPMGMYLTAVGGREEAKRLAKKNNGQLYSYPALIEAFEKLPPL